MYNKHTIRMVTFEGLNFCGLESLDDCVGLYFHGIAIVYIIKNFKTQGFTQFITQRPWVVVPKQSDGTTKSLRVINSVNPCVLKFNCFRL